LTPFRTPEVRYHVLATKLLGISGCCAALVFAVCCGEDEPLPLPSLAPPIVAGGVCHTTLSYCIDETSLLVCRDRIWTERSCADECADSGYPAAGCSEHGIGDDCACTLPEAALDAADTRCDFTLRRCLDSETIEYCTSSGSVVVSCASVCAELSPPRQSMGCQPNTTFGGSGVADCICSLAGTPCAGEPAAVCDGTTFLARCVAGTWQIDDCALECGPGAGPLCSAFAGDAGAGCTCGG
jgi:hypothetical protein